MEKSKITLTYTINDRTDELTSTFYVDAKLCAADASDAAHEKLYAKFPKAREILVLNEELDLA